MPPLTRYFVKTSLVYLVLALLNGVLLVIKDVLDLPASIAGMFPVYIHLLVIGWLSQLIFGVAYWMFPVFNREKPHGNEYMAWGVYILLNAGWVLRAVAEVSAFPHMLDIHSIHNPAANAVHSQIYVAVDAILLFPYSPHFSVLGSSLQPFILLSQSGPKNSLSRGMSVYGKGKLCLRCRIDNCWRKIRISRSFSKLDNRLMLMIDRMVEKMCLRMNQPI